MAATTKTVRGLFSDMEPTAAPERRPDESGVRRLPVGALRDDASGDPAAESAPLGVVVPFPRLFEPEAKLPPPPRLPIFHRDVGLPTLPPALRGREPVDHFDASSLARPGSTLPPPAITPHVATPTGAVPSPLRPHILFAVVVGLVGIAMLVPTRAGVRLVPPLPFDEAMAEPGALLPEAIASSAEEPAAVASEATEPATKERAASMEATEPAASEVTEPAASEPAAAALVPTERREARARPVPLAEPASSSEVVRGEPSPALALPENPYAADAPLAARLPAAPAGAVSFPTDLPSKPGREDVERALGGVLQNVRACAPDLVGTVIWMRVRVASTGRVTTASVQDQGASSITSCMARAARKARFPTFRADHFTVDYPFRL